MSFCESSDWMLSHFYCIIEFIFCQFYFELIIILFKIISPKRSKSILHISWCFIQKVIWSIVLLLHIICSLYFILIRNYCRRINFSSNLNTNRLKSRFHISFSYWSSTQCRLLLLRVIWNNLIHLLLLNLLFFSL